MNENNGEQQVTDTKQTKPKKPNAKQNLTMRLSPDVISIIRSVGVVTVENAIRGIQNDSQDQVSALR